MELPEAKLREKKQDIKGLIVGKVRALVINMAAFHAETDICDNVPIFLRSLYS